MKSFEFKKKPQKEGEQEASQDPNFEEVVNTDAPEPGDAVATALWPSSESSGVQLIQGVSLITVAPTLTMFELHHRWPVMLQGYAEHEEWVDPSSKHKDLMRLLRPCPDDWIDAYEVRVVEGDGPNLIEPLPVKPRLLAMTTKGLFD